VCVRACVRACVQLCACMCFNYCFSGNLVMSNMIGLYSWFHHQSASDVSPWQTCSIEFPHLVLALTTLAYFGCNENHLDSDFQRNYLRRNVWQIHMFVSHFVSLTDLVAIQYVPGWIYELAYRSRDLFILCIYTCMHNYVLRATHTYCI